MISPPEVKYIYSIKTLMPFDRFFPDTRIYLGKGQDVKTFACTAEQFEQLQQEVRDHGGTVISADKLSPEPPEDAVVITNQSEGGDS